MYLNKVSSRGEGQGPLGKVPACKQRTGRHSGQFLPQVGIVYLIINKNLKLGNAKIRIKISRKVSKADVGRSLVN